MQIARKRSFLCGNNHNYPDYIQSSGTQYIDTGIKGSMDSEFHTKINWITLKRDGGWPVVFGAESSDNGSDSIKIRSESENHPYTCYRFGNVGADTTPLTYQINTDYEIIFNKSKLQVNSNTISINATSLTTPTYSICLFTQNGVYMNRCSTIKMYYFKWYKSGNLILHLIPAIKNNIVCMYDIISQEYFYNLGTGDFIAGYLNDN